jgi:hypothetical protein
MNNTVFLTALVENPLLNSRDPQLTPVWSSQLSPSRASVTEFNVDRKVIIFATNIVLNSNPPLYYNYPAHKTIAIEAMNYYRHT